MLRERERERESQESSASKPGVRNYRTVSGALACSCEKNLRPKPWTLQGH